MWPNPLETADLVTFTELILNGTRHFLCSDWVIVEVNSQKTFPYFHRTKRCHPTQGPYFSRLNSNSFIELVHGSVLTPEANPICEVVAEVLPYCNWLLRTSLERFKVVQHLTELGEQILNPIYHWI